ncbi:hypothetical protein [Porphyromonas endodontalis]|uniref:hypothetical protein n=1 Tax=Porphyromonas endodontalis TaxID=28124 RepID=UPI0028EE3C3F|nr:hypothetical protein [Porphyromonas endodontalis]
MGASQPHYSPYREGKGGEEDTRQQLKLASPLPKTPGHFGQKPFRFCSTPLQISANFRQETTLLRHTYPPKKPLSHIRPTQIREKEATTIPSSAATRPSLPLAPSVEVPTFIDKNKQHYSK